MDTFVEEFVTRTAQLLKDTTEHDYVDHTQHYSCSEAPAFDVYHRESDDNIIICAVVRCYCAMHIFTQSTQSQVKTRLIEYMKILGKYDMKVEYLPEREATKENVCPLPILAIDIKHMRMAKEK